MKLKVLSYNIHKGFSTLGTEFTLHQIRQSLRLVNPDLVLLQEVVGENHKHKSKIKDWPTETQFEFLADSFWHHYSYGKNAVFEQRHHGNAILSKYPIVASENINISNNKLEQRGLLHVTIQLPNLNNKKIHVFNVHLDLFAKGRRKQLKKIVDRAQSHVPNHEAFILGGDFNDWSESATPHFYEFLGIHESFQKHQGQSAKTFPSRFPVLRLDRIYYRGLNISQTRTLHKQPWTLLSDHLPILAEFEVN